MDRFKLKWRVFAFLLGFCALLLSVLWLFFTVLLTDMYKFARRKEIEQAMLLVEQNIDSPRLQEIISGLGSDKEIAVTLTHEFVPLPRQAGMDAPGRAKFETITEIREFTRRDGSLVSLTFHAMITPVGATIDALKLQLWIVTAIMIIFSVALAIIISRRVSKPIEAINNSAKDLGAGRYNTHFNGRGFLEIKELSDTLNAAAAELSKADVLRRELLANVSHDLRTPLSLIYSYAEMMHDFPEEITPEQTQMIMDETRRMTVLVNDALDISKLETGIEKLNASVFNLTRHIRDTTERVAELVRKNGYKIIFEYDREALISADEVKIIQTYYNLLVNAVNYTGEDKTIHVRQTLLNGEVHVEITDTGGGIAKEDLPYIWDRYYKVDKTHKRGVTGTGLGLSIVKKIMELHGAKYGVKPAPGGGSTFWISLKTLEGENS